MPDINELKAQTQNFANQIWAVADILHGPFNDDEYGEVILPFALLRRFECVLEPSREKVLAEQERLDTMGIHGDLQAQSLCVVSEFPFYNTSKYTLASIGAEHPKENLIDYKNGFSANVREILDNFEFDRVCDRLQKSQKIYAVVDFFKALDLNVPPRVMSNLYEELIWRFADTKHKASKEYLTPRDVVHLATTLVLDSDGKALTATDGQMRSIYDPTCGTCGFITDSMDFIRAATANNPLRTELVPYGQEVNDIACAMGRAMILLAGCEEATEGDSPKKSRLRDLSANILLGNTLINDRHAGRTFNYVFSNPPFGMDWKDVATEVSRDPRFAVGLPKKNDSSMLFLTHVAQKMCPAKRDAYGRVVECGHAAIVLSGGPLFTGNAGSGPSEIRRWLFENDLVEAIVQLPAELFYNTPITSYLWILSTGKSDARRNKILLIDASSLKTPIKNIGKKRFMMSRDQINKIAEVFRDFKDGEISRVLHYTEFGARTVTVGLPLRESFFFDSMTLEVIRGYLSDDALASHFEEVKGTYPLTEEKALAKKIKSLFLLDDKEVIKNILQASRRYDPKGTEVFKAKKPVFIPSTKQQINFPLSSNLQCELKEKVLPFLPGAVFASSVTDYKDKSVGKVKYEINFNSYFYRYTPPEDTNNLSSSLSELNLKLASLLNQLTSLDEERKTFISKKQAQTKFRKIPLRYLAELNPSVDLPKQGEVEYLPMERIHNGTFEHMTSEISELPDSLMAFAERDLLIAKVTPCFENGNICIATNLTGGVGLGSTELYVIRPDLQQILPEYLLMLLQSAPFKQEAAKNMRGTGGLKRIPLEFLADFSFPIPSLEEQKDILDHLTKITSSIGDLFAEVEDLENKIREYKSSVITSSLIV